MYLKMVSRLLPRLFYRLRSFHVPTFWAKYFNGQIWGSLIWVLLILGFGLYMYYGSILIKKDIETRRNHDVVALCANYVESYVIRIRSILLPIASLDVVKQMEDENGITDVIQSVYLNTETFSNLYVFDRAKKLKGAVLNQNISLDRRQITEDDELFHAPATLAVNQTYITNRRYSFFTHDTVLSVQVPVRRGLEATGIVVADVNMDKLRENMAQIAVRLPQEEKEKTDLLLFDGNGNILYHSEDHIEKIDSKMIFNQTALYKTYKNNETPTIEMESPFDGQPRLFSFAKIPGTSWSIMISQPVPTIHSFFYKYIWRDTVALILFLLFTIMLHRKLKNSISREEDLWRQTILDPKTLLYNLKYFIERASERLNDAQQNGYSISIVLIDIDFFKNYNDTQGHLKGDYVLQEFSSVLRKGLRDNDIIARYGGEEFIILLEKMGKDGALSIADRIRQNVEGWNFDGGKTQPGGKITASFGIATYPHDSEEIMSLIEKADLALYKAKRNGRNRVETYNSQDVVIGF